MHLSSLISACLLLTPILAAPLPSCDDVLSFTNSGEYSITKLRHACSGKQIKKHHKNAVTKRSTDSASIFGLPAVRSTQPSHAHSKLDKLVEMVVSERKFEQQRLSTTQDIPTAPLSNHPPINRYKLEPIRSKKQGLARLCHYSLEDFQRSTHGLMMSFFSMSEDLAIASVLAVLAVFALLVGFDRWLRAKRRQARYRSPRASLSDIEKQGWHTTLVETSDFGEKMPIRVIELQAPPTREEREAEKQKRR